MMKENIQAIEKESSKSEKSTDINKNEDINAGSKNENTLNDVDTSCSQEVTRKSTCGSWVETNQVNSMNANNDEQGIITEKTTCNTMNEKTVGNDSNDVTINNSNSEKYSKNLETEEKGEYMEGSINAEKVHSNVAINEVHVKGSESFCGGDDVKEDGKESEFVNEDNEHLEEEGSIKDETDEHVEEEQVESEKISQQKGDSNEESACDVVNKFGKKEKEKEKVKEQSEGPNKRRKVDDSKEQEKEETVESEPKGQYLQEKLEQLLRETKRYTDKLVGHKLKASDHSKANKGRRTLLTEKEEDDMLLKEANEQDDTIILKQPSKIKGVMKYYQIEGLNWLYQLFRCRINGILADEMGLGKTLQTISLLSYLRFDRNIKRKSIIICPRSTLDNWHEEILKWCPELTAIKYYGDKDQRKEINRNHLHGEFDVLLTTYEIVIKEKGALYEIDWFYLVIDEAHRIKNEKSVLSTSVRFLRSENRLLLTGTPLHNSLKELWSLLNFLMPRIFDNSEEFDNLFNISKINTNDNKQSEIIMQLHSILKPFMLRRLKVEVEQCLPPKREIYVFVGMSKLQKKLYSDILSKNIDVINAMTGSKNQMLNILMQLRKCCNHPYLFDGIEEPPYVEGNHLIETSGKMSLLDKLLPRLKKENSRVLLFSQMTRLLDIVDDYCRWKNYPYLRIDGATPGDERQIRINQFNEPNSKYFIFLLSTRAGGIGINLTTANIVILFDSDYNPQMDIQAMDRAHRIGQKKKVIVYRFVTQNSVEEKIVERAAKKLKLDSLIIQKGKLNLSSASKDNNKSELHEIIHFGAPEVYKTQDFSSISDEDIDIILANAEKRTKEIENKLSNLEKTFDLTNISLDGGLNMYSRGMETEEEDEDTSEESDDDEEDEEEDDEGCQGEDGDNANSGEKLRKKKKKNIHKIRKTIKKFLKNNKKSMPFLDLGERKSKWKLARTERNVRTHQRKTLHGWRAEVKGGHDFQLFDIPRLDELDKILEKYEIYEKNEKRIEEILNAKKKEPDFKKVPTPSEFLDAQSKSLYELLKLMCPKLLEETDNKNEKKETESMNKNESIEYVENGGQVNGQETTEENEDMSYYKERIKSLLEKKKKRVYNLRFHDKNVAKCFGEAISYFKKHVFPAFSKSNNVSKQSVKSRGGRDRRVNGSNNENKNIADEEDMSKIDINQIKKEREELINEGFTNWNKAEYNKLTTGLILCGSENIEEVHRQYFANTRKTIEEVRAYVEAFFLKYDRVKGGARTIERIRKSDLQRKIVEEENELVCEFVEQQLATGINRVEQLSLPDNLNYEDMDPWSVVIPQATNLAKGHRFKKGSNEERKKQEEEKEKNKDTEKEEKEKNKEKDANKDKENDDDKEKDEENDKDQGKDKDKDKEKEKEKEKGKDTEKEKKKEEANEDNEKEEETETPTIPEEVKAVLDRENKIFLWLLYEQGVMQVKNIHCLAPYYWPSTLNFFRFSMFTVEDVQYRCRLIINAILYSQKQKENANIGRKKKKKQIKNLSKSKSGIVSTYKKK